MFSNHPEKMRQAVRSMYAGIAKQGNGCCDQMMGCGCGPGDKDQSQSEKFGYSRAQSQSVPNGADMGLGCGNPQAIASLKPGENVLDLGSGGGFDCLLAAKAVGENGRVIGVDMTPEMIDKSRANAAKIGAGNVEFRLGEIEHLPVSDATVDVIMSNCVINLAIDKAAVYREIFRVLKSGGRLAIADMVATEPLDDNDRQDAALFAGCIGGAATIADIKNILAEIGFEAVKVEKQFGLAESTEGEADDFRSKVISATIEAVKP